MKAEYLAAVDKKVAWHIWLNKTRSFAAESSQSAKTLNDSRVVEPIESGDCYYVSPAIVDLVQHAASSLPDESRWSVDLLPSSAGFVVLGKSLTDEAGRGQVSALGWAKRGKGVDFIWYQDGLRELMPHIGPIELPIQPELVDPRGFTSLPALTMFDSELSWWKEAIPKWKEQFETPITEERPELVALFEAHRRDYWERQLLDLRFLFAFSLFLNQKILSRGRVPLDRAARRRTEKQGHPIEQLVVVYLRSVRPKHEQFDDEDKEFEYSHRFMVNGHWRLVPFGPGRLWRRPTWILPFIKGPEDKPFIAKDRVFAVVR